MKLEADALEGLKVKDLQRELKKRELDTSGLKAALHQRLKEHLQQEEAPVEEKESKVKTKTQESKEEDALGDDTGETKKEEEGGHANGGKADEAVGDKTGGAEQEEKSQVMGEEEVDANEGENEKMVGKKRALDEERTSSPKKPKLTEEAEISPQPEDEDNGKPASSADAENSGKADEDTVASGEEKRKTLRIDNFIRPFTLNAVKALVQECGDFVENGFWMDAIKTHCFVTYATPEIAEKTNAALNGKVWPPENGRSLKVTFVDHTAMEVSQHGEANLPTRPKSNGNTQVAQRQKVTIDEFFQKTETKPVLYYLPLTDEQIKERKQRQSQQPQEGQPRKRQQPQEGQPRKRRHRGGRKRNRLSRFRH